MNGWLDTHLSRLQLAAAVRRDSRPEQRSRRFALLLYLDRSRPHGTWEEAEREEMKALDPGLFARVLQRIAILERRQTRPLPW